jgi:hypothetical protein
MTCSSCKGCCPTPSACQLPIAQATKPPRFAFLLADAFNRWPRGTPAVLLVLLLALWGFQGHLDQLADESIVLRADAEEQP